MPTLGSQKSECRPTFTQASKKPAQPHNRPMLPRTFIAVTVAGVMFALGLATFKWNLFSFVVSGLLGLLGGGLAYGWNFRLDRGGIGPAARERVAMQTAWRKGGKITAEQLESLVGMPVSQARATLEALCERGLCQKEGSTYTFYPKAKQA